jgi:hypothetical protein
MEAAKAQNWAVEPQEKQKYTAGMTPWTGDQPVSRTTQTQN